MDQFGQQPFGQGPTPFSQQPFTSPQFGQQPFGQQPFTSPQFGQQPFGQPSFNQPPFDFDDGPQTVGRPPMGQHQYNMDARLNRLEREVLELTRRFNNMNRRLRKVEDFLNIRED
jgi:hypothetical protein